jgi:hypothetical protein
MLALKMTSPEFKPQSHQNNNNNNKNMVEKALFLRSEFLLVCSALLHCFSKFSTFLYQGKFPPHASSVMLIPSPYLSAAPSPSSLAFG